MTYKTQYENSKHTLLNDKRVCTENRRLFKQFFEYQEYKLKRINGMASLDEASYTTLLTYVTRFRTVNGWFKNKPWRKLTRKDIKKVYDDLEDGRILSRFGRPLRDKETFYRRILRGKPFAMAGKADLTREVMEFYAPRKKEEVRFIKEDIFREMVDVVMKPEHKTLLWLAWDIGENVSSLLQLRKQDVVREVNEDTKEPEYRVNLRKETLKRARTARSEVTNYRETVQFLDLILKDRKENDLLFGFGPRMAKKVIERAVRITGARCIPGGQKVTLKDLRSSMACDLLSKHWTTDEVNYRLGHKPSSREIDKYVNFLAIDRRKPKKKLFDNQVAKLSDELEALKDREKLHQQRVKRLTDDVELLHGERKDLKDREGGYEERLDRVKAYTERLERELERVKCEQQAHNRMMMKLIEKKQSAKKKK